MSYPTGYSYVSPSAPPSLNPSQPSPQSIGFKLSNLPASSNMSGYPPYINQGGPPYPGTNPGYPAYPPSAAPSYPSAYPPTSNSSYPPYPQGSVNSTGASPYAPPNTYPASAAPGYPSYPQPAYSSQSVGYPMTTPGYPSSSVYHSVPLQQHSAGGPMQVSSNYPSAMCQPQQSPYQNYSQTYPSSAPPATYYLSSQPYGPSSTPYGSSSAAGGVYNVNQGTIVPYNPFNPKTDAEVLRKAMKGLGTDEKSIIRVLCNRTSAQRMQIALDYKTLFGKDLMSNLKDELSGNLEDVIVALMIPRASFLARCLKNAMSGIGTAELTLVEILCTSTNAEIREINSVYKTEYKRSLENDLRGDTSGYFKRLLVSLNTGNRDENPTVNPAQAAQDAQRLYQAGEAHWGTDESVFNSILVSQSYSQLRIVFQEYERISHRTIEAALQNEMSGDLLQGMLAVVKCVRNRSAFFAERLRNSLKCVGTADNTLIRIIVSRSEIDLKLIRDEYQRMFGRSLAQDISDDTSGDYKRVLLEIIK